MQRVVVIKNDDYLRMDIHTKRNLELTESIRNKERMYSLLWLLDFPGGLRGKESAFQCGR